MKINYVIRMRPVVEDTESSGQETGLSGAETEENYNESSGQGSELTGAEADENYNESNRKHCEEIDSVSRDEQSVFPRRAEENDNPRQEPQDTFKEGDSCSLSSWLDTTGEKVIDGSPFSFWGNDTETENTGDQNVLLQRIPRKEKGHSEGIIEPAKKKYRFSETESTSDQIVFSQQLPRNESSQSDRIFKPKVPEIITDTIRTDENLHQSSALNPCERGKQPMSGPSRVKYGSLPHFQQEVENLTAGSFGISERGEGSLVGGREKLPEVSQELGSHSRACGSNEICEKEVIVCDSDNSVSSPRNSPSAEKFTVRDVDSYEDDVQNRPENVEDSKPMHGSTDDHDA